MVKLKEYYSTRWDKIKNDVDITVDLTNVVDPYIDIKKKNPIMIIGESPGGEEVKMKEPFCGKSGKNLRHLISISGLDRKTDFLITNAMPFRTFNIGKHSIINRTPTNNELQLGSFLLEQELILVKPRIILILGNSAKNSLKFVPDIHMHLKTLKRGTFIKTNIYGFNTTITHTLHPSPLVYNKIDKREEMFDFFKNTLPRI